MAAFEPAVSVELFAVREPGASVQFAASPCVSSITLRATLPRLGTTCVLTSGDTPLGYFGAAVFDATLRDPAPFPGGCTTRVQPLILQGPYSGPRLQLNLPIPADTALDGVCLTTQAWWLRVTTLTPLTTGPLLLGLGR